MKVPYLGLTHPDTIEEFLLVFLESLSESTNIDYNNK
jgi:hypothetical protein